MVLVPDGVTGVLPPPPLLLLLPPQLAITAIVPAARTSTKIRAARAAAFRWRTIRIPHGRTTNVKTSPETSPPPSPWNLATLMAAVGVTPVAMVSFVVAAAPLVGVNEEGEKLQVELAGSPLQAKVMAAPNPKVGVAVMVVLPLLPLVREIEP